MTGKSKVRKGQIRGEGGHAHLDGRGFHVMTAPARQQWLQVLSHHPAGCFCCFEFMVAKASLKVMCLARLCAMSVWTLLQMSFLKADAETGFGTNTNERKGEKQTGADKEV